MLEKIFDSLGSGLVRVQLLREGLHGPLLDSYSGEPLHCRYANHGPKTPPFGRALRLLGEPSCFGCLAVERQPA
jgi:hypothetical protein